MGVTDIAATLKLYMCMCLVEVYETELSSEDKRHLAFVLALAGSVEQMAAKGGRTAVLKTAEKLSITFTQKAMAKAVPAGVGVAFSSSTNYVLAKVVGKAAVAVLAKEVT